MKTKRKTFCGARNVVIDKLPVILSRNGVNEMKELSQKQISIEKLLKKILLVEGTFRTSNVFTHPIMQVRYEYSRCIPQQMKPLLISSNIQILTLKSFIKVKCKKKCNFDANKTLTFVSCQSLLVTGTN